MVTKLKAIEFFSKPFGNISINRRPAQKAVDKRV